MSVSYHGALLNVDNNAKTVKGQKRGFLTAILYLAPADLSGYEVCPMRGACVHPCLNTSGMGVFANVQAARIRKTKLFFEDRDQFMTLLVHDLAKFRARAEKAGLTPCVRLNGTSDILWERTPAYGAPNVMAFFPDIQFYDYTKHIPAKRAPHLPANYKLVFSLDERPESEDRAVQALTLGWNVAVVFRHKPFPARYGIYRVIDGDADDLRFMDEAGVIVGLKAKGRAKTDTSGFVRDVNPS